MTCGTPSATTNRHQPSLHRTSLNRQPLSHGGLRCHVDEARPEIADDQAGHFAAHRGPADAVFSTPPTPQPPPNRQVLDTQFYHAKIKPVAAEWLAVWLQQQRTFGWPHEDLLRYLCPAGPDADLAARAADLPATDQKYLRLATQWLGVLLPHCLGKGNRVEFGLLTPDDIERSTDLRKTRLKMAVPFRGKDSPSEASEFAHPDITIGLTVLAYQYEGMREEDFKETMTHLYNTFVSQVTRSRNSAVMHLTPEVEVAGSNPAGVISRNRMPSQGLRRQGL